MIYDERGMAVWSFEVFEDTRVFTHLLKYHTVIYHTDWLVITISLVNGRNILFHDMYDITDEMLETLLAIVDNIKSPLKNGTRNYYIDTGISLVTLAENGYAHKS